MKKRDEKIAKNLAISREKNIGFGENSLAYILAENKKKYSKKHSEKNKLKELENKLLENERSIR